MAESESARAIWERRLEFLRKQEAITSNPDVRFELQEKIAEARAKLKELDDEAAKSAPQPSSAPDKAPTVPEPDRPGSPFIVGQPIERDEDLFGRQAQRDFLRSAIETGQSVQILGERRMGKTSLLKWVGRHASTWQDRPVIWINAQELAGQSPDALVLAVAEVLGRRREAEKALGDDTAAVVMSALLPAVLLVDEAAVLAHSGHGFDAHFFGVLRGQCQERRLVWVSASTVEFNRVFQDRLASSFLNDARLIHVGQLEEDAARKLALRLGKDSAAELVWAQAGGFAEGLQWLGDRLWRQLENPKATCVAFADNMENLFRRWWNGRNDADRELLRRCVAVVALADLGAAERRQALLLERLGLLVERDGNLFVPGTAWHDFVQDIADKGETAVKELPTEAAASTDQKPGAYQELVEAQNRQFLDANTADLGLPFLPRHIPDMLLEPFLLATKDLRAARETRNYQLRHTALERARGRLEAIAQQHHFDLQTHGVHPMLRSWLKVIAEREAILAREEKEIPQIPTLFLAGPTLLADQGSTLFRGRQELADIIDHDLTGDRGPPILLVGQRRMGKSSLLNRLPLRFGTGTRVVQPSPLGGSPHRKRPHRWIAEAIAEAWPDAPAPPETDAWGEVLSWLGKVDSSLKSSDIRILVALDEAERLQDGIDEGWATADLLDLIRAAGDMLERIRFLLATAYPLARLGPHWVDRLINVLPRQLGPLKPDEAESLIREPMPGFPDIYPDGGVERIIGVTAGHPYLVQLVCDHLCRHLNLHKRLQATSEDVEAAIDQALIETPLFDELWRQRTEDERRVLRLLAAGREVDEDDGSVVKGLVREGYVLRGEGIAVPMFASWIVENA